MAADTQTEGEELSGLRLARVDAFSDGVFAIAITLLVLDIAVPVASGDDLLADLVDQWPSYLAYVVSFSTIGGVWAVHSLITEYLTRATAVIVRVNLLVLMAVSLIPFPTALVAEHSRDPGPARVATTIYGITLLVVSGLIWVLWQSAVREHLLRPGATDWELRAMTGRVTPSLAGYVVMIVLGLFVPTAAVLGYWLIAIYRILPLGFVRAARRR